MDEAECRAGFEAMRRWRQAHPLDHAEDSRAYYERHRDDRLAQSAEYHRAHPEVGRARSRNYRALRIESVGSFTAAEWLALVEANLARCAYCGEAGILEPDHRIPLSRGGSNTIDNITPACRSCNARKHQMTEAEFRARLAAETLGDPQSTS